MQKIEFINSRGQRLVGIFQPGPLNTPIIMVHGFGDTKEENGAFDVVSKIINRAGFPVVRFDFAGSGESDKEVACMQTERDDLNDIIEYLRSKGYKKFGVVGHSLGGLISIKLNHDLVKTYVLWSSPTQPMDHIWDEWYSKEQIEELQSKGQLTIPTPSCEDMDSMIIDKMFVEESKDIDQKELLETIDFPVLLIHGDEDNVVDINQSIEAIQYLDKESELVTLKGASHRCENHLEEVGDVIVDWLETYLRK